MAWTGDPLELLRAREGLELADVDPRATPGWDGGKKAGRKELKRIGASLSDEQERLYAHGRTGGERSVLLVIQGLDTSGKGGIVRHVIGMMDPQGVRLRAFGAPSELERQHHYLWRVSNELPAPGQFAVFDRSHYEDVLIARVEKLAQGVDWPGRYEEIRAFEADAHARGTVIVKVMLSISYEGQGERLMRRLERPDKLWKYDPSDVDARSQWAQYIRAYQDAILATDTEDSPWYVVPADRRWYSRLAVSRILAHAFESLDLGWPDPTYDLDVERARLEATMAPDAAAEAVRPVTTLP